MSITIETNAVNKAPVYSYTPIFWDTSSDRDQSESGDVTVVGDNGGDAQYTVAALSGVLTVGDIVNLVGFTGAGAVYNGLQEVKALSGSLITTDRAFDIVLSPVVGVTMTRSNLGFQIRADIYVFDGVSASITGVTNPGGGEIEVTTSINHGLAVGDLVRHRRMDHYDGVFTVNTIVSPTVYQVTATFIANDTGDSLKGTIRGVKRQSIVLPAVPTDYRIAVQGILRTTISSDLIALGGANIVTPNDNSLHFHVIQFTEEFDDANGVKKEGDTLRSPERSFINATRQQDEDQTLDDFNLEAPTDRFLTNAPIPQKLAIGEEFQLSMQYDQVSDIEINYETFDNGGNSLGVTALTIVGSVDGRGIFPVNLITSSISRVDVWLFDSMGGIDVSERFRFDREDKRFSDPQRIIWLNRLGGYDWFTFAGRKKEDIKVKKLTFKKNLGVGFALQDAGRTTLSVVPTKVEESWSEFLDSPYLSWLEELYTSPNVFIEIDGNFIPIQVLTNSATVQDSGRLQQAKLTWARANDILVQGN